MTDELDLDAIEALANAATLGPWVVSTDLWDGMPVGSMLTGYSQDKQQDYSVHIVGKSPPDDISDAATDAAFIAASRSAVPALVAEVRRLRAALAVFADRDNWREVPEWGPNGLGGYNYIVHVWQKSDFSPPWVKAWEILGSELTKKGGQE